MTNTNEGPIEINDRGEDTHPSFTLLGASRVSVGPGGSSLFDSDIKHNHTVLVRLKTAVRKRDLNHDWIHGDKQLFEVEMSEAQWASFVSSMNTGDGVPCTMRYQGYERVPDLPHEPRLAVSMQETRTAADRAFGRIQDAMAAYEALDPKSPAKEKREAMGRLKAEIRNASANVDFASKTLAEHTENVVTKARADIEAHVVAKVRQLGIDTEELMNVQTLAIGGDSQSDG